MRIGGDFPYERVRATEQGVLSLGKLLRDWLFKVRRAFDGNMGFGDGTSTDNMIGCWARVADTGAAGVDVVVPHTLGVVPVGFLVMVPPLSGVVNKGAGAWTTSTVTVRCTTANQAVVLFVVPNSMVLLS